MKTNLPAVSAGPATRRRAASGLLAALLSCLLVLTGCSSIPLAGPVGTLAPEASNDSEDLPRFDAQPPGDGDSEESIIQGFLGAGINSADDYAAARQFLTKDFAAAWSATAQTLVVDKDPTVDELKSSKEGGTFKATLPVTRAIDANGVRTDYPQGRDMAQDFELAKENGEWRISKAPNGIMVDRGNFEQIFSPVTLYYYTDSSYGTAVPDVRWIARRQGRAASIASALLAGPAPYLQGALVSAFPKGAKLAQPSVPVDKDGVASVDVPEGLVAGEPDATRQHMVQQLQMALGSLSNIHSVRLTVDQVPITIGTEGAAPGLPQTNPTVDDTVVALENGRLVSFTEGGLQDISGGNQLGKGASSPSAAVSGTGYAVLTGGRTALKSVAQDGTVTTLATGSKLLAPSYDTRSWIWTAAESKGAPIQAFKGTGGSGVALKAPWLKGVTPTSVRVSVDGSRLAMTVRDGSTDRVLIAGILRDGSGKPTGLSAAMSLTTTLNPTRVQWLDDRRVVVYRPSTSELVHVEELGLDSKQSMWAQPLRGVGTIAIAPGSALPVYAQNADGVYVRRSASAWESTQYKAIDLAYRG